METYKNSQAYLSKQVNVNGKVITDQTINAAYDGKKLGIDIYDNGKHFYSQLNNNDIASILSHRASSLPLEKRLMKDFSIKKDKTYKGKSSKKKGKIVKKNNSSKKKSHKGKSHKGKSNKGKTYKKK